MLNFLQKPSLPIWKTKHELPVLQDLEILKIYFILVLPGLAYVHNGDEIVFLILMQVMYSELSDPRENFPAGHT